MFVTNWISTTKIQKISEITNIFRHYFLSQTEVLYFKRRDKFYNFNNSDLRNYPVFINIIHKFQESYGLTAYNLKEIDKYLWQLGKSYYKKYN